MLRDHRIGPIVWMRVQIVIAVIGMLNIGVVSVADDADLDELRTRAARYESQADWRLHFEDWDKLGVIGTATTNGAVVTVETTKVKGIAEALARAGNRKDLAVVVVSHRFHSHYAKDEGEKQLDSLSEKIRQAGFRRVVLLSETEVGKLPRRE